jgi:nucleoside-diphosphate-sugar epimerase
MSRVLVTGATGLVGSGVTKRLAETDHEVCAMGRRDPPRWIEETGVEYLQGDVRDESLLAEAVGEADAVVHLAAKTGAGGEWEAFREITVEATETLFDLIEERGGKRVVLVSSMGNYAGASMRENTTVDESFPLEPEPEKRPHYAHAKTLQDEFAQGYLDSDAMDLTIVRPGVVLSSGMDNPLLGAALDAKGLAWLMLDDGERDYQFVHLRDVAEGIHRVLETDRTVGEIYNLVWPGLTTRNDAVEAYRGAFDDDRPVVRLYLSYFLPLFALADRVDAYLPGPPRYLAYQLSRYVARVNWSGSKIEDHTGWAPETTIEETYEDLADV